MTAELCGHAELIHAHGSRVRLPEWATRRGPVPVRVRLRRGRGWMELALEGPQEPALVLRADASAPLPAEWAPVVDIESTAGSGRVRADLRGLRWVAGSCGSRLAPEVRVVLACDAAPHAHFPPGPRWRDGCACPCIMAAGCLAELAQ